MKTISLYILISLLGFHIISAQEINIKRSKIIFDVTNMKVNTVSGSFTGMKGIVKFDENDLDNSSFNVCIDVSTVNTGNTKRDDHLKNEDFFEIEKYPEICFKSEKISKYQDNFVTNGKLTMHGVTKEILIPFTFNGKSFQGVFKINRLDYNVGESTSEFSVSNEISLSVYCEIQ